MLLVDALKDEIDRKELNCNDVSSRVEDIIKTPRDENKRELLRLAPLIDSLQLAIEKKRIKIDEAFSKGSLIIYQSYQPSLMRQLEALGRITKWKSSTLDANGEVVRQNNILWWSGWAISLIFMLIEVVPILAILALDKVETQYDLELDNNVQSVRLAKLKNLRVKLSNDIEHEMEKALSLATKELEKTNKLKELIKNKNLIQDSEQLERILDNATVQSIKRVINSSKTSFRLKNPTYNQSLLNEKIHQITSLLEITNDKESRYKLIKELMGLILMK